MTIQVNPNDYAQLRPFFQPIMFDMFVTAVLHNVMNGRVCVDSLTEPTSGFVMTPESCLACGDGENRPFLAELRRIFEKTVLVGDVVNPDNGEFVIGYVSGHWDDALLDLMAGWQYIEEESGDTCHYRLTQRPNNLPLAVPEGYRIERNASPEIHDRAMAMWANAFDMAQFNTRTNFDKFWQEGFGFVALKDEQLVAACMTDVVHGNRCEIGIATAENHRRRGLATAVTAATVDYAFANGFREINWQTGDDIWGSRKTAEKVGFKLNLLFPCRYFEPMTDVKGVN